MEWKFLATLKGLDGQEQYIFLWLDIYGGIRGFMDENLSNQEALIASYVAKGYNNKKISQAMGVSRSTVNACFIRYYVRLGYKDQTNPRTRLAVWYAEKRRV